MVAIFCSRRWEEVDNYDLFLKRLNRKSSSRAVTAVVEQRTTLNPRVSLGLGQHRTQTPFLPARHTSTSLCPNRIAHDRQRSHDSSLRFS
jgi:hypothetical protein